MDARENNLPKWTQELLADLRQRIRYGNEPLLKEIATLRPKVAALTAKCEALTELLSMAAKGGHVTSMDIMSVIGEYAPWKII